MVLSMANVELVDLKSIITAFMRVRGYAPKENNRSSDEAPGG
jgi:hypothetical protein